MAYSSASRFLVLCVVVFAACGSTGGSTTCTTDDNCSATQRCLAGKCVDSVPGMDGGRDGGGADGSTMDAARTDTGAGTDAATDVGTDSSSTTDSGADSGAVTDAGTDSGSTGDSGAGTDAGTDAGAASVCGNGLIETGEECDGDLSPSCTAPGCASCRLVVRTPTCGDACADPGEGCGEPGLPAVCTSGSCIDCRCSCGDGIRDLLETDVDCGGGDCPDCGNGRMCTGDGDCVGNYCNMGVCADRPVGCSDGQREGFTDVMMFPNIAGCSGGWSVEGVLPSMATTTTPQCSRAAGDDGANPTGTSCSVADLCAPGWHLCATVAEVVSHSATGGCSGVTQLSDPQLFFVTGASGPGGGFCGDGENDLFGCGNYGAGMPGCTPLNFFSGDLCTAIGDPPWHCPSPPEGSSGAGYHEARHAAKLTADHGGVLCCTN